MPVQYRVVQHLTTPDSLFVRSNAATLTIVGTCAIGQWTIKVYDNGGPEVGNKLGEICIDTGRVLTAGEALNTAGLWVERSCQRDGRHFYRVEPDTAPSLQSTTRINGIATIARSAPHRPPIT